MIQKYIIKETPNSSKIGLMVNPEKVSIKIGGNKSDWRSMEYAFQVITGLEPPAAKIVGEKRVVYHQKEFCRSASPGTAWGMRETVIVAEAGIDRLKAQGWQIQMVPTLGRIMR